MVDNTVGHCIWMCWGVFTWQLFPFINVTVAVWFIVLLRGGGGGGGPCACYHYTRNWSVSYNVGLSMCRVFERLVDCARYFSEAHTERGLGHAVVTLIIEKQILDAFHDPRKQSEQSHTNQSHLLVAAQQSGVDLETMTGFHINWSKHSKKKTLCAKWRAALYYMVYISLAPSSLWEEQCCYR